MTETENQPISLNKPARGPRQNRKATNALILYDCCKPDPVLHTNIELLIIYHKDLLTAELVARQFDFEKDEDCRLYLNYMELYDQLERKQYAAYEEAFAKEFKFLEDSSEKINKIPFEKFTFHIKKDMIVDFILERINVTIGNSTSSNGETNAVGGGNVKLEFSENAFNHHQKNRNTKSSLLIEKPRELTRYDIKHHRQHSVCEMILKDYIEKANLQQYNTDNTEHVHTSSHHTTSHHSAAAHQGHPILNIHTNAHNGAHSNAHNGTHVNHNHQQVHANAHPHHNSPLPTTFDIEHNFLQIMTKNNHKNIVSHVSLVAGTNQINMHNTAKVNNNSSNNSNIAGMPTQNTADILKEMLSRPASPHNNEQHNKLEEYDHTQDNNNRGTTEQKAEHPNEPQITGEFTTDPSAAWADEISEEQKELLAQKLAVLETRSKSMRHIPIVLDNTLASQSYSPSHLNKNPHIKAHNLPKLGSKLGDASQPKSRPNSVGHSEGHNHAITISSNNISHNNLTLTKSTLNVYDDIIGNLSLSPIHNSTDKSDGNYNPTITLPKSPSTQSTLGGKDKDIAIATRDVSDHEWSERTHVADYSSCAGSSSSLEISGILYSNNNDSNSSYLPPLSPKHNSSNPSNPHPNINIYSNSNSNNNSNNSSAYNINQFGTMGVNNGGNKSPISTSNSLPFIAGNTSLAHATHTTTAPRKYSDSHNSIAQFHNQINNTMHNNSNNSIVNNNANNNSHNNNNSNHDAHSVNINGITLPSLSHIPTEQSSTAASAELITSPLSKYSAHLPKPRLSFTQDTKGHIIATPRISAADTVIDKSNTAVTSTGTAVAATTITTAATTGTGSSTDATISEPEKNKISKIGSFSLSTIAKAKSLAKEQRTRRRSIGDTSQLSNKNSISSTISNSNNNASISAENSNGATKNSVRRRSFAYDSEASKRNAAANNSSALNLVPDGLSVRPKPSTEKVEYTFDTYEKRTLTDSVMMAHR